MKREGIQYELTVPKTPQQNGVADRMNRTLVESVGAMLADSKLPERFFTEALATGRHLCNRCSMTVVNGKTPFEMWTGKKTNVKNLCIFCCDAYAHVLKDERKNLDSKTNKNIISGYGNRIKGYQLYDNEKKIIFVQQRCEIQ